MPAFRRKLLISAAFVLALMLAAVLGQPAPAVFAAVVAVPGFTLGVVYFLLRRRWGSVRLHLAKVGFYAVLFAVASWTNAIYARASKTRAEAVIAACERHAEARGGYPGALEELVPGFMAELPRASPAPLGRDRFYYYPTRERDAFTLGYLTSGIVMYLYSSSDGTWRVRD